MRVKIIITSDDLITRLTKLNKSNQTLNNHINV